MDYIERPKKVSRAEASVQDNKQLQKNIQSQFEKIYDKLDEIVDNTSEGTWTPIISTIEGVNPTVSYTYQYGYYWKMGKYVFIQFRIRGKITALNGTYNYSVIKGLPFDPKIDRSEYLQAISLSCVYSITDTLGPYTAYVDNNNYIRIQGASGANATVLKITNTSYFELSGAGWYRIKD